MLNKGDVRRFRHALPPHTTPSPAPPTSNVRNHPSFVRNIPGNRPSQRAFACGKYWRAFASIDVIVGARACKFAVWINAAPGQLMSPPAKNTPFFTPADATRIIWVNPFGDFTTAPVQPNSRAKNIESTSINDSSITTGHNFAASCMSFSGCAFKSRAVGCSTYLMRRNPSRIRSFNFRANSTK